MLSTSKLFKPTPPPVRDIHPPANIGYSYFMTLQILREMSFMHALGS